MSKQDTKPPRGLAIKTHESIKGRGVFNKTRMCVYFQRGRCLHGDDCQYAHKPTEVRVQPDLRKTTLCEAHAVGECKLEAHECRYAHGLRDLRATQEVFKTAMCRFWLAGKCSLGRGCRHAHGPEEMRVLTPELPLTAACSAANTPSPPPAETEECMRLISQLLATLQFAEGEPVKRVSPSSGSTTAVATPRSAA